MSKASVRMLEILIIVSRLLFGVAALSIGLYLFINTILMVFNVRPNMSFWRDLYGSPLNAFFLPNVLNDRGKEYRARALKVLPLVVVFGAIFWLSSHYVDVLRVTS